MNFDGVLQLEFPKLMPRSLHLAVSGDRQDRSLPFTRVEVGVAHQFGPRVEQPECALVLTDAAEKDHVHGLARRGLGTTTGQWNRVGDHRYPRGRGHHPQPVCPHLAKRYNGAGPAEGRADHRLYRPR